MNPGSTSSTEGNGGILDIVAELYLTDFGLESSIHSSEKSIIVECFYFYTFLYHKGLRGML